MVGSVRGLKPGQDDRGKGLVQRGFGRMQKQERLSLLS